MTSRSRFPTEEQLRHYLPCPTPAPHDERIRAGVARLKQLATYRVPPYDLPGDSHLEDAVRDILALATAGEPFAVIEYRNYMDDGWEQCCAIGDDYSDDEIELPNRSPLRMRVRYPARGEPK